MSQAAMVRVRAEEVRAETFAPFGKVIQQPAAAPGAGGSGWSWWGELALMGCDERPYGIGYLSLEPGELKFDWAERHMRSLELLVPLDGECLVYVGPGQYPEEPARLPALDSFRVFRVGAGQAVLLDKGVWHGPPLAYDKPLKVMVLLLENTGSLDLHLVRFEQTPVQIDVEG